MNTSKIYFYIEGEEDNKKYIGLSAVLRKKYHSISRCYKFIVDKDKKKYGVNINLTDFIDKNEFDSIVSSVSDHFNKEFLLYYKSGEEINIKYTYTNYIPPTNEKKKYSFINDE